MAFRHTLAVKGVVAATSDKDGFSCLKSRV
jgi:hypothetical protein